MKNIRNICVMLILLGGCTGLLSQNDQNVLLIQARGLSNGVELKWQPLNPDHWDAINETGYHIERVTMDESGNEIEGSNTILVGSTANPRMMPKDSLWFAENGKELDGLIRAMGALMYDSTFRFPDNKLMTANTMRYNYLLYEARQKSLPAEALGLILLDSTVTRGASYQYSISADLPDGTTLSNSVQIEAGIRTRILSPEGVQYPKYEFPGNLPLSRMISSNKNEREDQVIALHRAYEDSIVLRWAPNSPEFWSESIETGYILLRQEAMESGEYSDMDTIARVMPWAKKDLNDRISGDDMALIAANNLYGSNVRTNSGSITELASIYESRYGFSIYAAERSILAAEILGLRYVDYDVESGKKYRYRIICEASNSRRGNANISLTNTFVPVSPPSGFKLLSFDGYIQLEWDKDANKKRFSSYILERSDDKGLTFQSLTDIPIVFLEDPENPPLIYNFIDSVENYVKRIYRLKGNTSFAEASAPAEVVGMSVDLTPPPKPTITQGEYIREKDTIYLQWDIPPLPSDFAGFKIELGGAYEGPYEALTDLLPVDQKSYAYTSSTLDGSMAHYFKVLAQDTAGNTNSSVHYYVHVPDYYAPDPPPKVEGHIQDNGKVHIVWEHSKATDVDGYWLYFANNPKDEFSLINTKPIKNNYYSYKIQEKFLNETIYYTVAAVDKAGNRSKVTPVLAVERPDHVPPVKPRMESVKAIGQNLEITWENSVSKDVMYYLIFKREYGENGDWILIDSVEAMVSESKYLDQDCQFEKEYEYKVQAKDDAELYSEFPVPLSGKVRFKEAFFKIGSLTAALNKEKTEIHLNWTYDPPILNGWSSPYKFYLLKSSGQDKVKGVQLLPNDTLQFIDTEFEAGNLYNYAIKVQFDNGKSGELSPVKSVIIR